MKAVGFTRSLPITDPESFIEFETPIPQPTGRDLLVKISAISVNPVDFKIRQSAAKDKVLDTPKIIGWDAVGTVEAVGENTSFFKKGDKVYYAGDITRSGSNAEYQLIDERIVGRKPASLTDGEAAAIPLTALTAWEAFYDRIRLNEKDKGKTVLLIAGAGGVGSMAIQIAKKVAGLKVVTTASRPETIDWCKKMGADIVVNHHNLVEEIHKEGIKEVDFILDFADAGAYWDTMAELIKPQGHIVSITSAPSVALNKLKNKSASFSWEFMFTRSTFRTDDMQQQHEILNTVADLLDKGTLKTTLTQTFRGLSAASLKAAHQLQESGKAIGKSVIVY
jgi:NADPH2:quinone reductase